MHVLQRIAKSGTTALAKSCGALAFDLRQSHGCEWSDEVYRVDVWKIDCMDMFEDDSSDSPGGAEFRFRFRCRPYFCPAICPTVSNISSADDAEATCVLTHASMIQHNNSLDGKAKTHLFSLAPQATSLCGLVPPCQEPHLQKAPAFQPCLYPRALAKTILTVHHHAVSTSTSSRLVVEANHLSFSVMGIPN